MSGLLAALRRFSVKHRLGACAGLCVVALLVCAGVGLWSAQRLTQLSEQVFVSKDVVADILPPPMYLIELRLVASQVVDGSLPADQARAEVTRLAKEYDDRVAHWTAHPPFGLEQHLLVDQHRSARALIVAARAFVERAAREPASALHEELLQLHTLYARHRADVDRTVGVGNVVRTMSGISDSSRKIADIIGVIDDIAFQTNILALNAAVEAARAGEQGRGFAVVASEVRALAQRSAEAAKEIKSLITASVEQVEAGSTQVELAGRTMREIVDAIQHVATLMSEISTASTEQSSGVAQVGEALTQMEQTTQQNAALVEQSAAAAESLKQQAQQLVEAVAVFRPTTGCSRLGTAEVDLHRPRSSAGRAAAL